MKNDSSLDRLARAYPAAVKADAARIKPPYDISCPESVLDHVRDVSGNTMSRAIMLAVMLDQYDSGEVTVETAVHQSVAVAFEQAFNELAEQHAAEVMSKLKALATKASAIN